MGLIKGIVLTSIIVTLLVAFCSSEAHFLRTSKTKPFIVSISLFLTNFIPGNIKSTFYDKGEQIKEFWRKKQARGGRYNNDSKAFKRKRPLNNGGRSKGEKGVNWKMSNKIRKEMI